MKDINENEVKYILANYREMLYKAHQRIIDLYSEFLSADEIIESVSMKKCSLDGMPGSIGGIKKDLSAAILKHQQLYEEMKNEIFAGIDQLRREEDMVHRVWICYQALRGVEHEVLKKMYVEGGLYQECEDDLGLNHREFEFARNQGIQNILEMYYSSKSNIELATESLFGRGRKKRNPQIKKYVIR